MIVYTSITRRAFCTLNEVVRVVTPHFLIIVKTVHYSHSFEGCTVRGSCRYSVISQVTSVNSSHVLLPYRLNAGCVYLDCD